ncbi:hypothetical protein R3P38DRAFT_3245340 [Favolaschia claudopus]|uniref:Uncharacterized protein n=1 Tax=Favolaschia claudopus TaxID=2862362 RepID=A0AAV9Z0K3_9AGAR
MDSLKRTADDAGDNPPSKRVRRDAAENNDHLGPKGITRDREEGVNVHQEPESDSMDTSEAENPGDNNSTNVLVLYQRRRHQQRLARMAAVAEMMDAQ